MTNDFNTIEIETFEQFRRCEDALKETLRSLARATAYRANLQDHKLVAFCVAHAAKLEAAMAAYGNPYK